MSTSPPFTVLAYIRSYLIFDLIFVTGLGDALLVKAYAVLCESVGFFADHLFRVGEHCTVIKVIPLGSDLEPSDHHGAVAAEVIVLCIDLLQTGHHIAIGSEVVPC